MENSDEFVRTRASKSHSRRPSEKPSLNSEFNNNYNRVDKRPKASRGARHSSKIQLSALAGLGPQDTVPRLAAKRATETAQPDPVSRIYKAKVGAEPSVPRPATPGHPAPFCPSPRNLPLSPTKGANFRSRHTQQQKPQNSAAAHAGSGRAGSAAGPRQVVMIPPRKPVKLLEPDIGLLIQKPRGHKQVMPDVADKSFKPLKDISSTDSGFDDDDDDEINYKEEKVNKLISKYLRKPKITDAKPAVQDVSPVPPVEESDCYSKVCAPLTQLRAAMSNIEQSSANTKVKQEDAPPAHIPRPPTSGVARRTSRRKLKLATQVPVSEYKPAPPPGPAPSRAHRARPHACQASSHAEQPKPVNGPAPPCLHRNSLGARQASSRADRCMSLDENHKVAKPSGLAPSRARRTPSRARQASFPAPQPILLDEEEPMKSTVSWLPVIDISRKPKSKTKLAPVPHSVLYKQPFWADTPEKWEWLENDYYPQVKNFYLKDESSLKNMTREERNAWYSKYKAKLRRGEFL